jgi:hypothetical protein
MKIPTYKSVQKKAMYGYNPKNFNPIEKFIIYYSPKMGDKTEIKNFMRNLQKVVDYTKQEEEKTIQYFGE